MHVKRDIDALESLSAAPAIEGLFNDYT